MGTKWRDKTLAEKIFLVCSGICIFICAILIFCNLFAIVLEVSPNFRLVYLFMALSLLFQHCANWRENPLLSTVFIGLQSFVIGGLSFALLIDFLKNA